MSRQPNEVLEERGYNLQHLLGKGAFAHVWLTYRQNYRQTYRPTQNKACASKVVTFGDNQRQRWETENEIEILSLLNGHQNIVQLETVIRDDSFTVLVLDHIQGPPFIEGILNWPYFSLESARTTLSQLVRAIHYCHSNGIVHRDLSPDNIVWSTVPSVKAPYCSPELKIIDFNLARRMKDDKDLIHVKSYGNPSFMSPESLVDNEPCIGCPTDVWSLGVISFLLLGGYLPFWDDNYQHLIDNIIQASYAMPKQLWNHVDDDVINFIRGMLELDPLCRITTKELIFDPWLTCKPLAQTPLWERKTKWVAHERLVEMFGDLEKQKQSADHRKFSLTPTKRRPYVPCFNTTTNDDPNDSTSLEYYSSDDGSAG